MISQFGINKNYFVPIYSIFEQNYIVDKQEEILPLCERLKWGEDYGF